VAIIRPFRGLRYNTARIGSLSRVVTQPYDRVHDQEQQQYYDLSPYNFTRIIKGRVLADDHDQHNVYTRARSYARAWQAQKVLIREARPAIYVHDQTYVTSDGKEHTRRGFVAALQLTEFNEGVVLPHERTLSGPKVDRLNLTRATRTGWGQVFVLYADESNDVNEILGSAVADMEPMIVQERVIERGVVNRFWVVDQPDVIAAVAKAMAPKRNLVIADGHHRYETALNYRGEMRERYPGSPNEVAFNHVMATMVSTSDPGLVILPTHRLIHSCAGMTGAQVLEKAREFFDVVPVSGRPGLQEAVKAAAHGKPSFGFYDGSCALLTLRDLDVPVRALNGRTPGCRILDVSVLHELFVERVLGVDKAAVEHSDNIDYLRDAEAGFAAVDAGKGQFLLLMNATRIEQVQACIGAGQRMPQKSTDFYPKVISGLVALPLNADEILGLSRESRRTGGHGGAL